MVAPGASPSGIRLSFVGSERVETKDGVLEVQAQDRTLVQRAAVAYQQIGGNRVPVEVRYRVAGRDVGFDVGQYDRTEPLVIDPVVSYSTYFGATGVDAAYGVAVDAASNAYVVGVAEFADLPGPVVRPHTPLHPGSTSGRRPRRLRREVPARRSGRVDFASSAARRGTWRPPSRSAPTATSTSAAIPTRRTSRRPPALSTPVVRPYGEDEFLIRLAPDGTTFRYSTLLGAEQPRWNGNLAAIAIDAAGRAYVAGTTGSNTFPATAWDSRSPSSLTIDNVDAFVARFSSDGARLDWSRLFGGSFEDYANALSIDQYGGVYVVGATCSTDFTVLNALYPTHFGPSGSEDSCSEDGFLTYVWNDGSLGFSTYLGGTGGDWMTTVGQGLYDRVFVGGMSDSPPPPNVYKPSTGPSGVIYQITPNGNALVGTRYVGGTSDSQVNALVFTPDPNWFWVLGSTDGVGFPYGRSGTPIQGHPGGGVDFFLQKWDALRMDTLGYSDTYGGGGNDNPTGIARNSIGDIFVTGYTRSGNFPLTNAAQGSLKPAAPDDSGRVQQDGVVARLNCDIHELGTVPTLPAAGGNSGTWTSAEVGCVMNAVSETPWLHVTGYDGSHAVLFSFDPNPTSAARTGYIVISDRDRVPITQYAGSAPPDPPPAGPVDVVLNPRDATLIRGTWTLAADDLHGQILTQPDAGTPKIGTAAAAPANYFEFTFQADANTPYHLWIHGRAQERCLAERFRLRAVLGLR